MNKTNLFLKAAVCLFFSLLTAGTARAQLQGFQLLNEPIDISPDFQDFKNTYYLASKLVSFNPETGKGKLSYERYEYFTRMAFNNMMGCGRYRRTNSPKMSMKLPRNYRSVLNSHPPVPYASGPNPVLNPQPGRNPSC